MSLTIARRREIEALAEETRVTALGASARPPVNINRIAEVLGLAIKVGKFNNPNTLGVLDRANNFIAVSEVDDYVRQAFTVAHEIGHFKLHTDKAVDVFYRQNFAELDQEATNTETEANVFAAALLMPKTWVDAAWPVYREVDVMAKAFGVSYSAMRWRLKNLGYI